MKKLVDDLAARGALKHPGDAAGAEAARVSADNWVTKHVTSDLVSRLAAVFRLNACTRAGSTSIAGANGT